jgi:exopolysaccharide production protein ExoQ
VSQLITLVYAVGILFLFLLNRDSNSKTSKALLLPAFWLLIAGSRNIGEWLHMGAPTDLGDAYIEGNPIDRNILAALIGIGLIVLISRRKRVGQLLRSNAPILLFFGYCGLSILWSDYPYVGFKRWNRALGDLVMVLIVLSDEDWVTARKQVLAWVAFLLLPLSILFIKYYPDLGRSYGKWDYQASWTGVATTKNELGMICMIFGLASVMRVLEAYSRKDDTKRNRLLIAHGAIVATAAWLIYMANSATSKACFILGCAVLVLTGWTSVLRKSAFVHIIVAAMLSIAFSALFLNLGSSLVEDLGRNSTLTGRTDVWTRALQVVDNPVFGAGFESFWVGPRLARMRSLDSGLNQAHNGYLEIYLNLGWIGAIVLAAVIVSGYRNIITLFRRQPDPARLSLAYFVAALTYNFTEAGFKMRSPVWIAFLLATIAVPMAAVVEKKTLEQKVSPATRPLIKRGHLASEKDGVRVRKALS